jgi:hypothetical protein
MTVMPIMTVSTRVREDDTVMKLLQADPTRDRKEEKNFLAFDDGSCHCCD